MDRQSSPAQDTDVSLTTSEPRELVEENNDTDTTVMTECTTSTVDSTVNISNNSPLPQDNPSSSQTNTTPPIPSFIRQRRRTRDNFTIMTPIQEEEYAEGGVTNGDGEDPEVSFFDSDTDSTVTGPLSVSAPSPADDNTPQATQASEPSVVSNMAQGTSASVTAYISNPQQYPFINPPPLAGQMAATLLLSPPLFSYNTPHRMTNCWFRDCCRPTMSSDVNTIACPRCNDHSFVRYCGLTHFLSDIREHYIHHCGRRTNLLAIDESTMTPVRTPIRPFIGVTDDIHDSVERHRQALYHAYPPESDESTNSTLPVQDYYVFTDADIFDATGLQVSVGNLYQCRGAGSIAASVHYDESDPKKGQFKDLLERLLVLGVSAGREKPASCRMLFVWVKENLRGQGEWSEAMITRMCLAMRLEFGWRVDEELRN